jgi:Ca-activated chloride channel family protein
MDSYPVEAAATAASKGIRIYTVGLGNAAEGARIPLETEDGQQIWLEHEGEQVWTKLHPELLQRIAEAGEGLYIPAGTSNADMAEIYESSIAPGAGRDLGTATIERHIPRYRWFVLPAVCLLIFESFMGQTRRKHATNEITRLDPSSKGAVT